MTYVKGDAIEALKQGQIDYLLHQCNCTVGMKAGFAKALCDNYKDLNVVDNIFRSSVKNPTGMYLLHGKIVNLYSQLYPGAPSEKLYDCFEQRLLWLKTALVEFSNALEGDYKLGIPLIASGLASDKKRKGTMSDFEYFHKYVEFTITDVFPDIVVFTNTTMWCDICDNPIAACTCPTIKTHSI